MTENNLNYFLFILFFLCIIAFLNLRIKSSHRSKTKDESASNGLTYFKFNESRTSSSSDDINGYQTVLEAYNLNRSMHLDKSNIVFFYLLTDYKKLKNVIVKTRSIKFVGSLLSIDLFCSKSSLYDVVRKSMNTEQSLKYLPQTYILGPNQDLRTLVDGELYILKKNLQRQNGLLITKDLEKIRNAYKDNYVVCQKVLQDVFTIDNRKINLRVYLLITMISTTPMFYVYNNGFVYYTNVPFSKNSEDPDVHITTGYIDRTVYDKNPMSLQDLENLIQPERYSILRHSIHNCIKGVMQSFVPIVQKYDTSDQTNFVILGCDFAVSSQLTCKLMEINKGPDLDYKDERDRNVKYNLVKDTLITLGIIKGHTDNYLKINAY